MGMTITHFMWGYQPHFRIGQEVAAKRLFQILDSRFNPEIFLVGILTEERDDRFPACVEPEEDFWIKSEDFNKVPEVARSIIKTYPEKNIIQSHPVTTLSPIHNMGLLNECIYFLLVLHVLRPVQPRHERRKRP